MPLFGFSDITFNKQTSSPSGPLKALEGSAFETSTLRYPIDVGNFDKGHYMVLYIREQTNSTFAQKTGTDDATINQSVQGKTFNDLPTTSNPISNFGSQLYSKVESVGSKLNAATNGALGGIGAGLTSVFGRKVTNLSGDSSSTSSIIDNSVKNITNKSFIKTTQLTKDAIALYMPDTLLFNYQQNYSDVQPGKQALGQAASVGASLYEQYKKTGQVNWEEVASTVTKSAVLNAGARAAGALGDVGSVAFRAVGLAVNPMLELIYTSPAFRTFQFDFMFYPRDERESLEVQKIIEKLKFHSSPEFEKNTGKGFLIPPSEFDIRFYYGGGQNPNIPPIATCVLTTIDVNYAPNGWAAYEIPGENKPSLGRTGMPVAIQMSLQFKEVTYLTKEDYVPKWKPIAGE